MAGDLWTQIRDKKLRTLTLDNAKFKAVAYLSKRTYAKVFPGRDNPFDADDVWNELARVEDRAISRLTELSVRPTSPSDDAAVVWVRRLAPPLFSSRSGRATMHACIRDAAEIVLEAATQTALRTVAIPDMESVPGWREELLAYRGRLVENPSTRVGEFLAELSGRYPAQSWFSEMAYGEPGQEPHRSGPASPGLSLI